MIMLSLRNLLKPLVGSAVNAIYSGSDENETKKKPHELKKERTLTVEGAVKLINDQGMATEVKQALESKLLQLTKKYIDEILLLTQPNLIIKFAEQYLTELFNATDDNIFDECLTFLNANLAPFFEFEATNNMMFKGSYSAIGVAVGEAVSTITPLNHWRLLIDVVGGYLGYKLGASMLEDEYVKKFHENSNSQKRIAMMELKEMLQLFKLKKADLNLEKRAAIINAIKESVREFVQHSNTNPAKSPQEIMMQFTLMLVEKMTILHAQEENNHAPNQTLRQRAPFRR